MQTTNNRSEHSISIIYIVVRSQSISIDKFIDFDNIQKYNIRSISLDTPIWSPNRIFVVKHQFVYVSVIQVGPNIQ